MSSEDPHDPERWLRVHDLPGKGAGLLDCSRRLNLARGCGRGATHFQPK